MAGPPGSLERKARPGNRFPGRSTAGTQQVTSPVPGASPAYRALLNRRIVLWMTRVDYGGQGSNSGRSRICPAGAEVIEEGHPSNRSVSMPPPRKPPADRASITLRPSSEMFLRVARTANILGLAPDALVSL